MQPNTSLPRTQPNASRRSLPLFGTAPTKLFHPSNLHIQYLATDIASQINHRVCFPRPEAQAPNRTFTVAVQQETKIHCTVCGETTPPQLRRYAPYHLTVYLLLARFSDWHVNTLVGLIGPQRSCSLWSCGSPADDGSHYNPFKTILLQLTVSTCNARHPIRL
jgi:hypothetical protein